jgi:hypothetical protein
MRLILFILLIFSFNVFSNDTVYTIVKGDSLSEILYSKNLRPIYGKHGSMRTVVNLNSFLKTRKRYRLYPGEKVILPIVENQIEAPIPAVADADVLPIEEIPHNPVRTVSNNKQLSHSDLSLSISSRFLKLESVETLSNSQASLISDVSTGWKFSWGHSWSDELYSHLDYESYKVNINDSSSSTKTLLNKNQTLANYEFGLNYLYSSKLKFTSSLLYGETLVNRSTSLSTISIQKFISPKIQLGLNYTLLSRDELKLFSITNFTLSLPTTQDNYSAKLGTGYKLGIGLEDKLAFFKIKGDVFYQTIKLKMTEANFTQTEVGVLFSLSKDFGNAD